MKLLHWVHRCVAAVGKATSIAFTKLVVLSEKLGHGFVSRACVPHSQAQWYRALAGASPPLQGHQSSMTLCASYPAGPARSPGKGQTKYK